MLSYSMAIGGGRVSSICSLDFVEHSVEEDSLNKVETAALTAGRIADIPNVVAVYPCIDVRFEVMISLTSVLYLQTSIPFVIGRSTSCPCYRRLTLGFEIGRVGK